MVAIPAHALEASTDDLEVVSGRVQVRGTPTQGMDVPAIATLAYTQPHALPEGVPLGLEATTRYTPDGSCTRAVRDGRTVRTSRWSRSTAPRAGSTSSATS